MRVRGRPRTFRGALGDIHLGVLSGLSCTLTYAISNRCVRVRAEVRGRTFQYISLIVGVICLASNILTQVPVVVDRGIARRALMQGFEVGVVN